MFDFRYHALSLAAVLLALAVGVLLGVAIGDSNLVSSAKKGLTASLSRELGNEGTQIAQLQGQNSAQTGIEQQLATIAVNGKLAGSNVGLLFLGQSSDAITGYVRDAVTAAGGQLAFVGTVREPLDLAALSTAAAPTRYEHLATDPTLIEPFGERVAIQLVTSSDAKLLPDVESELLTSESGPLQPLEGVVIVRDEPSGMSAADAQAAAELETGLVTGFQRVSTPAVGGELTTTTPSQIPWYSQQKMPSVNDLDDVTGRVSLVYELTGYNATLGVPPASSLLPELPSTGSGT